MESPEFITCLGSTFSRRLTFLKLKDKHKIESIALFRLLLHFLILQALVSFVRDTTDQITDGDLGLTPTTWVPKFWIEHLPTSAQAILDSSERSEPMGNIVLRSAIR